MNNRLDFISKFKDSGIAIAQMSGMRQMFIEIDNILIDIHESLDEGCAGRRSVDNSRLHLEEACQHAIKALSLLHEDRS